MEAAHTSRLRTQSPPPGVELCAAVVVVDEVAEEAWVLAVAPKHFILMEVLTFFGYFMCLKCKSPVRMLVWK